MVADEHTPVRDALAALDKMCCPTCGSAAEDMRMTGFNPTLLREAGRCFWFNGPRFLGWECNAPRP